MRAAFVFSGQGAQKIGMGKDLYERSPAAAAVYSEAREVLGWNVAQLCFEGPEEKLTESRNCQVAVFTTSMAALAAFREKYPSVTPVGAAGLSLGEYGALCCAGCFDFAAGLRLVAKRAELMDAACKQAPGAMAGVITDGSVTAETFQTICHNCGIWVANCNTPFQTVISGGVDGVAKASAVLRATAGVRRVIPLNVAGAYHSGMMAEAGKAFGEVLQTVRADAPKLPVAQNFTGTITHDPAEIKANLAGQVAGSVRWIGCVKSLAALGADTFIEFGPGTVLTGLIRKIDPAKTLINIQTAADLDSLVID